MELIPRNLTAFTTGTREQRKIFASSLLDDYRRTGFAKITNHGLSDSEVRRLFSLSRAFFRLTSETKESIAHVPGPKPQRGFLRVGAENSSKLYTSEFGNGVQGADLQDCREHFDMGSPHDTEYENKWVDETRFPDFRSAMETYFDQLADVSSTILEALELALDLPIGTFNSRVSNSASEMRLLHYPAIDVQTVKAGKVSRIWPHYDLGVITLLFQDGQGGLEMQDRTKPQSFLPISPNDPSEMITNISETLQRWTNRTIPAGMHQVTIPDGMKHLQDGMMADRYSVAFFCKADRQTSVGPMSPFISEGKRPLYDEMSAIEYQQQRLQTAY